MILIKGIDTNQICKKKKEEEAKIFSGFEIQICLPISARRPDLGFSYKKIIWHLFTCNPDFPTLEYEVVEHEADRDVIGR